MAEGDFRPFVAVTECCYKSASVVSLFASVSGDGGNSKYSYLTYYGEIKGKHRIGISLFPLFPRVIEILISASLDTPNREQCGRRKDGNKMFDVEGDANNTEVCNSI